MSGEFFVRYRNLELDDSTGGADNQTRIASSCLFCTGILLQIYVIGVMTRKKLGWDQAGRGGSNRYVRTVARIEMFSFSSHHDGAGGGAGQAGSGKGPVGKEEDSRREAFTASFSIQDDDDETMVLF
jgi:hypothetical protein